MLDFDDDDLDGFLEENEPERGDDDNLVTYMNDDILPSIKRKPESTNSLLEIIFYGTEDEDQPHDFQIDTLNFIKENLASILSSIYEFAYQEREPLEELYGDFHQKSYEGFPLLASSEEVRDYISLETLIISDENVDGITTFGFTGNCTWDREHGLGIQMYKDKILDFGSWDDGRYYSGDVQNPEISMIEKYTIGTPITHILDTLSVQPITKSEEETLLDLFNFLIEQRAIYGLRSTNLNLSNTDKIKLLQHTKSLSLRNKGIEKIPETLTLLKDIENLNFSSNKILKIPSSFSNFKKLSSLDISFNKFKELPEVIFDLHTIEYLNCSYNKIKKIPVNISNLKDLIYLTVSNNKLKKLPASLLEIKTLKYCYGYDNSFSKKEMKNIEAKFENAFRCYV